MDTHELVRKLVDSDCLDEWSKLSEGILPEDRVYAFSQAEPLWLARMARAEKLLLHTDVLMELARTGWKPTELQRRMIWASVLASLDGPDRKERFRAIKAKLEKKYGNKGWFDIYQRVKPAYAARMRLQKQREGHGPAFNCLASKTILFGAVAQDQKDRAFSSIPKV